MKAPIAIDVDGVLSNTGRAVQLIALQKLGLEIPEEPSRWDFRDCLSPSQFEVVLDNLWTSGLLELDPIAGAAKSVASLKTDREIHVVTARPKATERWTRQWLQAHNLPYTTLTLCPTDEKPKLCKQLGCAAIIEDRASTAIKFVEEGLEAILLTRSYNLAFRGPASPIHWARDWQEVLRLVGTVLS